MPIAGTEDGNSFVSFVTPLQSKGYQEITFVWFLIPCVNRFQLIKGGAIPSIFLKITLHMILHALDYLHSECHLVHTGM